MKDGGEYTAATPPVKNVIRLATDQDGPAIGKLFAETGYPDYGVDWSAAKVGGWWIVAERGDRIEGAVQVMIARPFGYIGEVLVHPGEASDRMGDFGDLTRRLFAAGFAAIRASGAEIVRGFVHESRGGMMQLLDRYGGQSAGTFTLYWRRLW